MHSEAQLYKGVALWVHISLKVQGAVEQDRITWFFKHNLLTFTPFINHHPHFHTAGHGLPPDTCLTPSSSHLSFTTTSSPPALAVLYYRRFLGVLQFWNQSLFHFMALEGCLVIAVIQAPTIPTGLIQPWIWGSSHLTDEKTEVQGYSSLVQNYVNCWAEVQANQVYLVVCFRQQCITGLRHWPSEPEHSSQACQLHGLRQVAYFSCFLYLDY